MNPALSDRDTTVMIWEYLYRARVPYLQSRHIEDIQAHGVVLTGVKEIDNDLRNQMQTVYLTINDMVEYFKKHVPVLICDYKDIQEIYQAISNHLQCWKVMLERGVNIGGAPFEDLIAMDQFANKVYDHAKYQFTQDYVDSLFIQHLGGVQRMNANNFFNRVAFDRAAGSKTLDDGTIKINGDDAEHPERESLENFFKTRTITLGRY